MKKIVLYLPLLLLLTVSCDKDTIAPTRADQFIKHYGYGLHDTGVKVLTKEDGFLVLGSITNPENGDKDICIIQTDSYGNTNQPIKTFGGIYDDMAYRIVPNEQGYLIAGSTIPRENGDWDIYLLQLSATADMIWEKSYPFPYDNEAFDVIIRSNGNIVCTGYTKITETNSDILYFETTAQGDSVLFNHKGNALDEVAYAITELDNMFLFAGYHIPQGVQSALPGIYILKWNGQRSAIPQEGIKPGLSSVAKAILPDPNGNFLIACEVQPDLSGQSEIQLFNINESMEVQWSQAYSADGLREVNQLTLHNGQLYFCGSTSGNTDGGSMYLAMTDLDGNHLQTLYSGSNSAFTAHGFDFTADGGYILTGSAAINDISTIVLSKFTPEGGL